MSLRFNFLDKQDLLALRSFLSSISLNMDQLHGQAAPRPESYDRYMQMAMRSPVAKRPRIPLSARIITHYGTWGKAMKALGFDHVGKVPVDEYDLPKPEIVRPSAPERPAVGSGSRTFEIPWSEVVYGTLTVRANSREQAIELVNDMDITDRVIESRRGPEFFENEIRDVS